MILPRGSIVAIAGATSITLSEHNRGDFTIAPKRIENSKRMIDGTLRKNVVATKMTYSCSWTDLPSIDANTVDGYAGAAKMRAFHLANPGKVTLTLKYDTDGAGTLTTTDDVMISNFTYLVKGRSTSNFDLVDVSIEFEEV